MWRGGCGGDKWGRRWRGGEGGGKIGVGGEEVEELEGWEGRWVGDGRRG